MLNVVDENEIVKRQQHEILDAQWLDITEALSGDSVHEHNKNFIREALKCRYLSILNCAELQFFDNEFQYYHFHFGIMLQMDNNVFKGRRNDYGKTHFRFQIQ